MVLQKGDGQQIIPFFCIFIIMKRIILYIALIAGMQGCISNKSSGRYVGEPVQEKRLQELESVMEQAVKVYAAATYATYSFNAEMQYTEANLGKIEFQNLEAETSTESSMATATLIKSNPEKNILLTCYHIFDYPDTVKQFYYRSDGSRTAFLRSVSVKTSQNNFTKQGRINQDVSFIAYDEDLDIAVLETDNPEQNSIPFRLETIQAKTINTGETVYIPGFPSGYKMVTEAIVSKPNNRKPENVMLDANFNRGFSGAPFYIYSPEKEKMLLAGIVTTAASETKNVLAPEYQSHQKIYDPAEPYEGPLYVERDERVKYGITFTVTIEKLNDFYTQEKSIFEEKNINLDSILK